MSTSENQIVRSFWGANETENRVRALSFRYGQTRGDFLRVLLNEAVALIESGEEIAPAFRARPKNPRRPNDFNLPYTSGSSGEPLGETEGTLRSLKLPESLDGKLNALAREKYSVTLDELIDGLVPLMLERRAQAGERTFGEEPVPNTPRDKILTKGPRDPLEPDQTSRGKA